MKRLIFAAAVAVPLTVTAHEWYPLECCHEHDCAPVEKVERVEALKGRWMTTKHGRVFVPDSFEAHHKIQKQPDGRDLKLYTRPPPTEPNPLHVCMRPYLPAHDKPMPRDPNQPMTVLCVIQEPGI